MDREIRRTKPAASDIANPHLRKFFKVVKIANEPALNVGGFWPKPAFHSLFSKKNDRAR